LLESINKTKKKIILKAIYLYNQKGFFNVLNQEIAKASNVSLSNLNYHFPTKKDLIISVCGYMSYTLNKRISENKLLINNAIILEMARIYLEFENEFKFFYLDTHNILKKYSLLDQEMGKQIHEAIQMIKNLNYIAIGKGYMQPEPAEFKGAYDLLANKIWMTSHFWYVQADFKKQKKDIIKDGLISTYGLLYPYLTEKGVKQYLEYLKILDIKI